ncbi:hypothetical protein HFO65_36720 [Rhizobium laguerreae]|uniref:hypothetical protein n=1 Tax=Rhizobium laguerreae TaxID=1076926 RepID=UPI001C924192|nr:hypothetical protein [Rhizobium laguerreae]MBY3143975.1 hypothetical protein [Rhizobium laguerreae]MBY3166080.1 hypothetical protein [Rhizobium laguerreae]MBY3266985.1 hypothetical protein [Rhizobium laguerreae]MBY3342121.1 hypothetical protein [Rhizobium laguerreae]
MNAAWSEGYRLRLTGADYANPYEDTKSFRAEEQFENGFLDALELDMRPDIRIPLDQLRLGDDG